MSGRRATFIFHFAIGKLFFSHFFLSLSIPVVTDDRWVSPPPPPPPSAAGLRQHFMFVKTEAERGERKKKEILFFSTGNRLSERRSARAASGKKLSRCACVRACVCVCVWKKKTRSTGGVQESTRYKHGNTCPGRIWVN